MILFLILVAIFSYFVPSFIAVDRRHENTGAIFALNLFLGWTFLGWVIAFVWSCTSNVKPPKPPIAKKIDPALQWDRSAIYENGQPKDKFLDKLQNLDLR
jgi:T4 superinfection immunity protein